MSDFHNKSEVIEGVVPIGYHYGVLEDDGLGGRVCVACFGIPSDARAFADYLATIGRSVDVVDLYRLWQGSR